MDLFGYMMHRGIESYRNGNFSPSTESEKKIVKKKIMTVGS